MSEVLEKIKERRSIRSFKATPVPKELLEKIAEAGTYAATSMGKQSPKMIVVTNKELRDRLSKINGKIMGRDEDFDPFYGAPAVIVVLAKKSVPAHVYDGSLVMGNLMLASYDLGLGSCWIHRAKETFETKEGLEILESLGISDDYEGIGNCVIGYTDGDMPRAAKRKSGYVQFVE